MTEETKTHIEAEEDNIVQLDKPATDFQMFEEMIESMHESIENLDKVREQQELLVQVLTNAMPDKFKEFIDSMSRETNNIVERRKVLIERVQILEDVDNACKADESKKDMLCKFMAGIGMFHN